MTDNEMYRILGNLEASVKSMSEDVRAMRAEMHAKIARMDERQNHEGKAIDDRIKKLENRSSYQRGAGWVLIGLISAAVSAITRHIPWPFGA